MAILSKIRERSMALILVIGLALFAFVLDPSSIQDFFNSTKVNTVGEVGGEVISRKDFSEAVEAYKAQVGNRLTDMQASKMVWDNLVREKIYKTQLSAAGVSVGENDVWIALTENQSVKTNPQFLNAAGLFDENKLKEFLAIAKSDDPATWTAWSNFMGQLKTGLETTAYNNLITAGVGASLKEGELQYLTDNTKISSQYVYVPYASVPDSLVTVTKSDIETYIKANPTAFKVEASTDIKYVKFAIVPTQEDANAIKNDVANLLNDTNGVKGFKNADNYADFFTENDSDLALTTGYDFKNTVSVMISEDVFKGKEGDVFGPYRDRGYFKISKIDAIVQIPDSVKGAHILIPFIGSLSSTEDTKKTEAQAKKSADSIYRLVRRNKKRFATIADQINTDMTKDKGGDIGWITKDVAFSANFDKDFADYLFFNKKGDVQVVKSRFGYQVIRIDESKNKQKAVKLVTYGRNIVASEATENTVFQNAQTFALALSNGNNFDEVVKEKGLNAQTAFSLKMLDETVPGIGNERDIVSWSHKKENEIGAYESFDINGGHVVAVITNKTFKGLMSAAKATNTVRPILLNQKKAAIINKTMTGSSLADLAKATNQSVRNVAAITMQSPIITGVGFEPKVVGAMYSVNENVLFNNVEGTKGVFAFVVTKREVPATLPNYDSYRNRLASTRRGQTGLIYNAIKDAAEIEDNRAAFYGID
ncbi:MAG: SurA N-terminal domain-containing protein [Polaribacter sp.]|nr:SurA N-terminal domain-containing protein [Polaribacter sp.]MDG1810317.1 SurA N-terminal domain-containing protein [Polaribacter sp.]MDG1993810.1 SurA N-terminal domain-containing protein [Polaribacter sp.]